MEGRGTYTLASGVKYVGDMVDGEFHGEGTLHFPNGAVFKATWRHGKAVSKTPSGVSRPPARVARGPLTRRGRACARAGAVCV
jgi:hypothetical protein